VWIILWLLVAAAVPHWVVEVAQVDLEQAQHYL
jgi:hypothetical protein